MDALTYALDTSWRTILKDLGVAPADVLRRAGLADDLLQQPTTRVSPEAYYKVWDSIEVESRDPLFPIRLCNAIRSESFSPPLFAALCSPNLLVAARRVAKYETLIGPMRLSVTEGRDVVTIEFTWPNMPLTPPASLMLFKMLLCVLFARMGTREKVRPVQVTAMVLPTPVAPYEEFFGSRMQRGPKQSIVFTAADATRPFLTSNEPLWAVFEPELRQRLSDLTNTVTTARRVRASLLEALPSGLGTIEDVARKLALSKRTLQRRIELEGTSFQRILKETRAALAQHYLERTTLPSAEIAFLLGFEEPNSFHRAFRTWTGTTPEHVRLAKAPNPSAR